MSGPAARPRADQWRDLPYEIVRSRVGDDLDENEREHSAMRDDMRAVKRLLFSILVSTTTASILLAVNIAGGFGR